VDLVQNKGLHISSDNPDIASSTTYERDSITCVTPRDNNFEQTTIVLSFPQDESGTLATREWVGNEALNFLRNGNNGNNKTLSFIDDGIYGATYNSTGISVTNYDESNYADFDVKLDVYALQFTVWNDPNSTRAKYGEEGILIGPGGRLDSGV
jgi:hypothetical protein